MNLKKKEKEREKERTPSELLVFTCQLKQIHTCAYDVEFQDKNNNSEN